MDMQHQAFLRNVRAYIEANPDAAAYVSDYVARGIQASRMSVMERAADMEVALSVAIAKRWKGRESLILSKLKKWNGKSSLPWDDEIKALESA